MNWKRVLFPLSIFAAAIWMAGSSPAPEAEPTRDSRARRIIRLLALPFRRLGTLRLEHWMLIVTAGLAAATVWLAWDGHQQLAVLQGQLDEMRVERRPWIEVDAYIGGVTWDAQGVHIALRYEIKNSGRSPALHVLLRDEIVPFLSPDPHFAPFVLLKQMSQEQRKRTDRLGYPVLPGQKIQSQLTKEYSREELEKYQRDIDKAYATHASDDTFLQLTLGYVVDYTFDVGTEHHQTYCLANIDSVNPNAPLGPGLSLPIGKDLLAPSVRLDGLPLYCGAD